jgi:ATP-dependent DNA helicase RecG
MERAKRGEQGLSNQEIRQITKFDRNHVKRMLTELRKETTVFISGYGAGAKYYWKKQGK